MSLIESHRMGAIYHLMGEAIPTPDDVFGPAPRIWPAAPHIWKSKLMMVG